MQALRTWSSTASPEAVKGECVVPAGGAGSLIDRTRGAIVTFLRRCQILIICRDESGFFIVSSRRMGATMRHGLPRQCAAVYEEGGHIKHLTALWQPSDSARRFGPPRLE